MKVAMLAKSRLHRLGTLLALTLLLSAGCSALWEPDREKIESWVSTVPPGSPSTEIYNLLKGKGFSPHYENPKLIVGKRTYRLLIFEDYWSVGVTLGDAGQVVSHTIEMDQ